MLQIRLQGLRRTIHSDWRVGAGENIDAGVDGVGLQSITVLCLVSVMHSRDAMAADQLLDISLGCISHFSCVKRGVSMSVVGRKSRLSRPKDKLIWRNSESDHIGPKEYKTKVGLSLTFSRHPRSDPLPYASILSPPGGANVTK